MASPKQTVKKTVRYLQEKGFRATAKKAVRHFGRKREERRFVEAMALSPEERQRQREQVFDKPLKISIVVPLYNTSMPLLREMIDSVCDQTYPDWELCLADGSDDAHEEVSAYCRERAAKEKRIRYQKLEENKGISENSNAALVMATGDYIALLDHDDLLTENALYEVRSAIEKTGADFLYSDEMIFQSPNPKKIIGIKVKPGFSPDTLLTNNYICHLTVFSRELLARAGGFRKAFDGSQDHDLILRMTDQAKGIAHIAKVLYLWRAIPASTASDINSKTYAIDAGRNAVKTFLRERRGIDAEVESTEVFPTMYRVRYPIKEAPSVRVILDARKWKGYAAANSNLQGRKASVGKGGDHASEWHPVFAKIDALCRSAGWDDSQWTLIMDDQEEAFSQPGNAANLKTNEMSRSESQGQAMRISADEDARQIAEGTLVVYARSGESRAALWNRIARETDEDYLLFIDGLPEPMSDGWLREMLSLAQLDHVGAAGLKLHFQRGTVRHAGLVIGMGPEHIAGRPYYVEIQEREGYFGQIAVVEDIAAVTDALMVSREKWEKVGEFSEEYKDSLFDVDFCLRLMEKGYYNVCTPHARLRMGSAKEIPFDAGKEYASYSKDKEIFGRRNARMMQNGDPYFNPNLSPDYEDWRLKKI